MRSHSHELRAGRQRRRRGAQQRAVVGVAPEAAGEAEHPHRATPPPAARDERELDRQRDVVRERLAAGRQVGVPVEPVGGAVDRRLERQAGLARRRTARPPATSCPRRGPAASSPRIVSSPSTSARPSSVSSTRVERKATCGWLAASKKSAREDVVAELLRRADRDRLDLRGALERDAVGAGVERRVDVVERAAERRDAHVADGEGEAGVDRICGVGAGERLDGGGGRADMRPPESKRT